MSTSVSAVEDSLDAVFDALANQPRREIVSRLARGPMTTPELGRLFGFSKQALNRHVGLLDNAGLITRTAAPPPIWGTLWLTLRAERNKMRVRNLIAAVVALATLAGARRRAR